MSPSASTDSAARGTPSLGAVLIVLCTCCGVAEHQAPPENPPPEPPAATVLRARLDAIEQILAPNPRDLARDPPPRPLVAGLFAFDDEHVFDTLAMTESERADCRELLEVFYRGVVVVLVSEMLHYTEVGVEEAVSPRGDVVVTLEYHLEGGSPPDVELHYVMRRTPDGWRVVDLTINEYRSTVEAALNNQHESYARGGAPAVIYNLSCSPQVRTVQPDLADPTCPPLEWAGWPEP